MMLATNGTLQLFGIAIPPPPLQSGSHRFTISVLVVVKGGVFEGHSSMGMGMEFGGYGVPVVDKEAMLRHFAPAMSQDGQIGVDRDTMMMWSTMPSTLECVFSPSSIFVDQNNSF
jgi:hypothetical protein